MESSSETPRVLVVAAKTAATQGLIDAVRARAQQGPASFTLLVPKPVHGLHKVVDPADQSSDEGQEILDSALPKIEEASGTSVEGMIGDTEPLVAIEDAINLHGFDEIIVSTLPRTVSRWLKLDLPSKLQGLGKPVTVVTADERVSD
jgi:hypothetical protein